MNTKNKDIVHNTGNFYKTSLCIKNYLHYTKKLTYRHILMPLATQTKLARQFYFSDVAIMTINTF